MPCIYEAFKTSSFIILFISDSSFGGSLSQDRNSCFMNEEIEALEGEITFSQASHGLEPRDCDSRSDTLFPVDTDPICSSPFKGKCSHKGT